MSSLHIKHLIDQDEKSIDQRWQASLNPELSKRLEQIRITGLLNDEGLFALAVALESFLIDMFSVSEAYQMVQKDEQQAHTLMLFHHQYVSSALKRYPYDRINLADVERICRSVKVEADVLTLSENYTKDQIMQWCAWVGHLQQKPYCDWPVFDSPKKIDFDSLIRQQDYHARDHYDVIPLKQSPESIAREVTYCLYCHHKGNDSCSKGLRAKKDQTVVYKNPVGQKLTGCPLDQKISQMHELVSKQYLIAALAVMMIDNPLCVLTGDRICRDCIDACIYQKFDLVDTPGVESYLLKQILNLPYGPEIYLLLLRWNPLRLTCEMPLSKNDHHVAVMGLGPAGLAMAYYLLMRGITVHGFDALNLEAPEYDVTLPVKTLTEIKDVAPRAFGGVMAYGITVRWDKLLLNLLWVGLKRFKHLSIQGDVRLGGTVTISKLVDWGFSHVVLATGAGLPKSLLVDGAYSRHMQHANSFLMELHLHTQTQNILRKSMQLPIAVIGGGLTAVDAATEAQVYYIKWSTQIYLMVDQMQQIGCYESFYKGLNQKEQVLLQQWCQHGQRLSKLKAKKQTNAMAECIQKWGGVSIIYYKSMQESSAYRQNHTELQHALDQGILYKENFIVEKIYNDEKGVKHIEGTEAGLKKVIPVHHLLVAIGTKPNIAYYYENRSEMQIKNEFYALHQGVFAKAKDLPVSVIGDLHPDYTGSVVKALASAKHNFSSVEASLVKAKPFTGPQIGFKIKTRSLLSKSLSQLEIVGTTEVKEGMLFRLIMQHQQGSYHMQAIVVSIVPTIKLWIDHTHEDRFIDSKISGLMGPSGTRIVSEQAQDVLVVADDTMLPWVVAAAEMMKRTGGVFSLMYNGTLPECLYDLSDHLVKEVPEKADILYCMSVDEMKKAHQLIGHEKRSYQAVVSGDLMCMLKGVCAQCVQWQVDHSGRRLKTVFACSWPVQPIELIDWEHLAQREQSIDTGHKLISLYENL